jgi:hypothetical protein
MTRDIDIARVTNNENHKSKQDASVDYIVGYQFILCIYPICPLCLTHVPFKVIFPLCAQMYTYANQWQSFMVCCPICRSFAQSARSKSNDSFSPFFRRLSSCEAAQQTSLAQEPTAADEADER